MEKIYTFLGLCLLRILSLLPNKALNSLGNALGNLGYACAKKRRKIGIKNLSLAFPEMPEAEKERIIREHFKYLLTSVLQYSLVFYASPKRLQQTVTIKNLEVLTEFYGKKPVILMCPHFVGLDLAAIRMSLDFVGFSTYTQQKNSLVADKLKEARVRFMRKTGGEVFRRTLGLRPIVKKLRTEKQIFYYLPDQDFGEKDSIFVPFFAHTETATIDVLPKLVALSDAVVIPMTVYRVGAKYEIEYQKPLENYPTDNIENDVIAMNRAIEKVVLDHMEDYYWLHKRFKTQKGIKERGLLYKDL